MGRDYERQRLTSEEYVKRIYNIYGEDISVLEPYVNQRTKILHRCNIHNYEWYARTRQMYEGHNGCKYCASIKRSDGITQDLNKVKNKVKEKCGDEFVVNNNNTYINYNEKMWFIHYPKDGISHMVYSKPDRIYNHKCAVCSGTQVYKGYNDIWTTNPELGKLLDNTEDGYKYTQSSNKRTNFKCPVCGYICENKIINQVNKDMDVRCPICNDGVSYPNKFIYNLLIQYKDNLDFLIREYKPIWCKFVFKDNERKGYYDIFIGIDNKKYIIEMDGGFHNKTFGNISDLTLDEINFIDAEKDRLAKDNNIELIRIDCDYESRDRYDFIKNNILTSKLKEIIDFSKINFDEANFNSQKSLIVECCTLWDNGLKASDIIKKTHVNKHILSVYLNKGMKYGLCHDYSSSLSVIRSKGIKVTCVNTKKSYSNLLEPAKEYHIDSNGIRDCYEGRSFYAGKDLITGEKLFWMKTEDYNKLTNEEIKKYLVNKRIYAWENNLSGKAVYCITTNEIFDSILDAASKYNISDAGIRKCCKGERKTSGKLLDNTRIQWMYLSDYSKLYSISLEELARR